MLSEESPLHRCGLKFLLREVLNVSLIRSDPNKSLILASQSLPACQPLTASTCHCKFLKQQRQRLQGRCNFFSSSLLLSMLIPILSLSILILVCQRVKEACYIGGLFHFSPYTAYNYIGYNGEQVKRDAAPDILILPIPQPPEIPLFTTSFPPMSSLRHCDFIEGPFFTTLCKWVS